MRSDRRRLLVATAATAVTAASASFAGPACAGGDDLRRLLCSGPAGSIPDVVARSIGAQLGSADKRRAIVENRPGAAGQLAVAALKAAPADGSTLLLAQGAVATVYPFLYARLGYDAAADLVPVSLAATMPLALAVGPAVPADVSTVADVLDWLRRHPAEANIGSPGTGTLPHLLAAMLLGEPGIAWQHVAYAGGPPAVTDLLGGRLVALVLPEGLLEPHHASGRARVLATSGATRSLLLPRVPTFAEQGRPDLIVQEWFAFFAPGRTPDQKSVV